MSNSTETDALEAEHERYMDAIKDDFLVTLTIGTDPTETFLVPKSQITCWGDCTGCKLPKMLEKAEKEMLKAISKSSASSAKDERSKKGEPQSSVESFSEASQSSQGKIREIILPEDDAFTWSVFFRRSNSPNSGLPEVAKTTAERLVRCWNFGIRYDFKEFADEAMIAIAEIFDAQEKDKGTEASITNEAIRESYCSEHAGHSQVRRIIAQEIFKSNFNKCKVEGFFHNWKDCDDCLADKAKMAKALKCNRPNSEKHRCGLVEELWRDVVEIKKHVLADRNLRPSIYERMKKRQGKLPIYTSFLVSARWKKLISSIQ